MHAKRILQKSLAKAFDAMHADRVTSLLGAVMALLSCGRLVLMDLARSYPNATRVRAPLKRLDRLLSNPHLTQERSWLYGAMSGLLLTIDRPLIGVDWSPLDRRERHQLLRASLMFEGRPLTLWEEVYPTAKLGNPKVERAFLQTLAQFIPAGAQPIILTDAGFRTPWFRAVTELGWDYIGRLRGTNTNIRFGKKKAWQKISSLLTQRRCKTKALGEVELTKLHPWPCYLIRSRLPRKGRQLLTKSGTACKSSRSRKAQRRGSETCLLVTSLDASAARIVRCYRQRMQIEESFRDLKCERFGDGFELSLTRLPERIANLLLIHALATFLSFLAGRSVDEQELTVAFGGVVGKRRHYSLLWLGRQLLRRGWLDLPPITQLMALLRSIRPFSFA